jgi:uncharacterized protein (TIGR00369 family)
MKKQGNSKNCFVCGVENHHGLQINFYEESAGKILAKTTVPGHFQGYPGIVHGGIIAAMLDEVSGRTIMAENATRWMVTVGITVRYRRPVPVEQPLRLVGVLKEDSGRSAKVHGEIFDENNNLLAECDAVLASVPQAVKESMESLPEEAWKVYPDEDVA